VPIFFSIKAQEKEKKRKKAEKTKKNKLIEWGDRNQDNNNTREGTDNS